MTTEKIQTAGEVLTDFLDAQVGKPGMDTATIALLRDLRSEGKLTKTALLRQLDTARNNALKDAEARARKDTPDD